MKWYDNKAVLLASYFIGPDPADRYRRWSKEKKKYVEVDRPQIVKVYSNDMGGVNLADMFSALYVQIPTLLVSAHLVLLDWPITRQWLAPLPPPPHPEGGEEVWYMPLLDFRAQVACALIKVGKQTDLNSRKRGKPPLEDTPEPHQAAPPPPPIQRIIAPSADVRLHWVDHFPIHADKCGHCRLCKNG